VSLGRRAPLLAAFALGLGCNSAPIELSPGSASGEGPHASRAFSTALAADPRDQTLRALERDAWRREERFFDAASPGLLFRSTRVPEAEIEAGAWTPEQLFRVGAQLFDLTFTPEMGFGGKDLPAIARFQRGRRGGPDARRCAACHLRGGPAGSGDAADNAYLDGDGDAQSSALERNPVALAGVGLVELLAREMNAELAGQRDALIEAAKAAGAPRRAEVSAKGVAFGTIEVRPDGTLDTSGLRGVDPDLVIKPFGWKGNLPTLRDTVEDELLTHHGMESEHLVATAPPERVGPFGGRDPDGDGVTDEISEGQVTALTLFAAMQEVPIAVPPVHPLETPLWVKGRASFEKLGCAACHVPVLRLASARFVLASRGGGPSVVVDLAREGAEPRIAADEAGGYPLPLFSDLKRHDMGPRLAEKRADRGVPGEQFLTPPLWGIARSRPYLHDARAPTLEDAILAHGGEARAAHDAFEALREGERAPLRVFLTSLTRAARMITP
jgi:hypothetical protein